MEILIWITLAALVGGIVGFLLLRFSHRTARRRGHDFLENPNEWGW